MSNEYPLKLSIIVPVYNVEKYLERCVNSLLHQDIDKSEYEIILVNDGSTDSSYEIAKKLANEHGNIVLLTQENKGQGAARNRGIEKSGGEYILFVDSDDYLEPNVLNKIMQIANARTPDVQIMQTKSMKKDGTFYQYKPPYNHDIAYTGEEILSKGYRPASVWGKLYRREFLRKHSVVFLEGIIHEDVDFNLKLFSFAKIVIFVDLCCYVYYWNELSTDKYMDHNKIRKSIMSDIMIANDLKIFSNQSHLSSSIKRFYQEHANSIVISILINLIKENHLDFEAKVECLATAKRLGVYPVYGRTNSWKTILLARILNCEWVLKCIMR